MKRALLAVSIVSLSVYALPCRYGNCPGEVGREGVTSGPTAPACPPQDGADCPHSCAKATQGPCPTSTQETYFSKDHADKNDTRADCKNGKCTIKLVGDLYLPSDTSKKHPAILFNHGSSGNAPHKPESICAIATYFLAQGYVIFMPHRRGYEGSTGQYGVTPLDKEQEDVVEAYNHLITKHSNVVETGKVAIMGHSLGGIVSIYANEKDHGQVVAISIAGGSESWCGNDTLPGKLKAAVQDAKTPIYFFEPKDDVSTQPTIQLSHAMGEAGHRYQATIFGPVANDPDLTPIHCGSEAHVCFVKDQYQVSRWAPSVLEFLQRFDVK